MVRIYEKINSYVNMYVVQFNSFDTLHSLTAKSEKKISKSDTVMVERILLGL
jgi:hypothetical protein